MEGVDRDAAVPQRLEHAPGALVRAGGKVLGQHQRAVHGEGEAGVAVQGGHRAVEVAAVQLQHLALGVGVADVEVHVRDEVQRPLAGGGEGERHGVAAVHRHLGRAARLGNGEAYAGLAEVPSGQVEGVGTAGEAHLRAAGGQRHGELGQLAAVVQVERRDAQHGPGRRRGRGFERDGAPGEAAAEVVPELLAVPGRPRPGDRDGAGGGLAVQGRGDGQDVLSWREHGTGDRHVQPYLAGDGAVPVDLCAVLAPHLGVDQPPVRAVDLELQVGAGAVPGGELQPQRPPLAGLPRVQRQLDPVRPPAGGGVERSWLERRVGNHGAGSRPGRESTLPCSSRAAARSG